MKQSFATNAVLGVDCVEFDRTDDQDAIGIFDKDLISNRIRKFIFLKDRDWSEK
jgi:hypothetical protein